MFNYISRLRQQVLEPVQANAVRSRDGGDQGAINQLLYAKKLWGDRHTVLHSRYNALARVHALRPRDWAAWDPAIVHFSRETKPWVREQGPMAPPGSA